MNTKSLVLPEPHGICFADFAAVMGHIRSLEEKDPSNLRKDYALYQTWFDAVMARTPVLGKVLRSDPRLEPALRFCVLPNMRWHPLDGLTGRFQEVALSVFLHSDASRAAALCRELLFNDYTMESPKIQAWRYLCAQAKGDSRPPVSWLDLTLATIIASNLDHRSLVKEFVEGLSTTKWSTLGLGSYLYTAVARCHKQWVLEALLPLALEEPMPDAMWELELHRLTHQATRDIAADPFAIQLISRVCPAKIGAALIMWDTIMANRDSEGRKAA